ncbi:MAG: hypothetical protein DHS20C09_04910 [marine bacterium B5-7]|nr:MAG: hypothetical protein DHS20C09_04910 [marine bacterium B5-7]
MPANTRGDIKNVNASNNIQKKTLMSQGISGMLTSAEDTNLTKQALMGVSSANQIKTFVSKPELNKCRNILNSYLSLANFPLAKKTGETYANNLTKALVSSSKVKNVDITNEKAALAADCGVFAAYSIAHAQFPDVILETVIYVFDWQKYKSRGVKGTDGFIQSGIWSITTRKLLTLPKTPPSTNMDIYLFPHFKKMIDKSTKKILLNI